MQKQVKLLTVVYLLFVFILLLSGMLDGIWSGLVYVIAFLLPLGAGLYLGGERRLSLHELSIDRVSARMTLPLVFPTVGAIFLLSYVTSLFIFHVFGVTSSVDIGTRLAPAIIRHALLPSVLEELLFRYLPMRLFARRAPRATLLLSAAFFALVHHSFFSMPYAFIAGLIFMALDLAAESVIPSLIIHFINNVLSVLWIFYSDSSAFVSVFWTVLATTSLISLLYVFYKRREYKEYISPVLRTGDENLRSYAPLYLAVPMITLAITELL